MLRRAAVVGGVAAGAHHMGAKSAQRQQAEADQNAQIADLQDQQYQAAAPSAPAPAAAPAAPAGEGIADQLAKLKSLLDSGVLTQAEFEAAKQAVIQGG
jgi:hypothetical protein